MDKLKSAFPYALGTVLIAIILSIVLMLGGMYQSAWNYLSYVGYIVLTIIGLKTWREKENGGFISYGMAMGYSTWMAVIFSVVMAIWAYVFFVYIAHDEMMAMNAKMMAQQSELMKTKYGMSDDQIQQALSWNKKFFTPGFITTAALFGNMLFLTIFNLIISAFMKKDNNSFEVPPNTSAY